MKRIFILMFIVAIFYLFPLEVVSASNGNLVTATLSIEVSSAADPSGKPGKPVKEARLIVINSSGDIIANVLTGTGGRAKVKISAPRDLRFANKNMGEVTVIAVANGFNEYINFSVPINELNDGTANAYLPLWKIDPTRRNEPIFDNGSFHRFTVFGMLDHYANQIGLVRQYVKDKSISPPPWGPNKRN